MNRWVVFEPPRGQKSVRMGVWNSTASSVVTEQPRQRYGTWVLLRWALSRPKPHRRTRTAFFCRKAHHLHEPMGRVYTTEGSN